MPGFFNDGASISVNALRRMAAQLFKLAARNFKKLVCLNLLFCAFCMLIVTIGPAAAALVGVLWKILDGEPVSVAQDFWDCFIKNTGKSFLCGLIYGAAFFTMLYVVNFYLTGALKGNILACLALLMSATVTAAVIFIGLYLFLLIAVMDMPLRYMLRCALLFGVTGLRLNLTVLLVIGAVTALAWKFPVMGLVYYIIIGFSLTGLIITHTFRWRILRGNQAMEPTQTSR